MAATPEQVGPYRIVSEIGRGGMAVVYLARQPVLGRSVALKELAPFLAGDPALAQRFIREARVAGSLNHPNVVTVFDFLEQDGVPYIAMEYLERGSLRPFVGRMSLPQVAGVLEGLLAALSLAEAMKIVHRDVKPENLLVTSDGGIKIADFGIAKAMQHVQTEEMLTPAGATVGTPAYMAPEQAMAQEVGPWTDLYQTGVVAYELLADALPFQAEGAPIAVLMKHISDPVPELPAGTDPALAAWVKRLLAKEPSGRPRSARAAWNELEEIIVEAVGPLWRREARLGEDEPTVEHTKPLTPARFSSWQDYVPAPTPRPPANTPPTPAPPPPVPRRETPVPEPAPPVDEVPLDPAPEPPASASGDSYVEYTPGGPNVDEPDTPVPRESADPVAPAPLDAPARPRPWSRPRKRPCRPRGAAIRRPASTTTFRTRRTSSSRGLRTCPRRHRRRSRRRTPPASAAGARARRRRARPRRPLLRPRGCCPLGVHGVAGRSSRSPLSASSRQPRSRPSSCSATAATVETRRRPPRPPRPRPRRRRRRARHPPGRSRSATGRTGSRSAPAPSGRSPAATAP